MIDPFGNYLCQKIAERSNQNELNALINKICPKIVKICSNSHGTRAIQKIYELVNEDESFKLLNSYLENSVVKLIKVPFFSLL